ncbi:MAG TPA: ATP-binding protein, partial [Geobacteraceae bacterium]|nr:ATP-binding protein [Geobacteraceae bacterium]
IVLTNLLGNAWKFTANRREAHIGLSATQSAGETVVCVSDNGVGFDMRNAHKLFVPFQRLHGQEEFAGDGIGLATVNSIVRSHGGRIWAESEPDRGAHFCFTLGPHSAQT